jgi:hypothetical protein
MKKTGQAVAKGEPLIEIEYGPSVSVTPPSGFAERVAACFRIGDEGETREVLPFVVETL